MTKPHVPQRGFVSPSPTHPSFCVLRAMHSVLSTRSAPRNKLTHTWCIREGAEHLSSTLGSHVVRLSESKGLVFRLLLWKTIQASSEAVVVSYEYWRKRVPKSCSRQGPSRRTLPRPTRRIPVPRGSRRWEQGKPGSFGRAQDGRSARALGSGRVAGQPYDALLSRGWLFLHKTNNQVTWKDLEFLRLFFTVSGKFST